MLDTLQSSPIGWPQFSVFIWFYGSLALDAFQQYIMWDYLGGVEMQIVFTIVIGLCLV